ncbi:MAG: DNA2/NAM7 family helicase, partial [Planctomycetales bacterium]|nr:DNA2/NAM7 family helicase [Planctomycetales bacterium]
GGLRGLASALLHRLRSWQLDGVDVWQDMGTYQHLLDARCEQSREFLRQRLAERLGSLLHRRREQLSKFLQALRSRSDGKQQKLFEQIDFPLLLAAFPVWLCKLSDLANVLPLQAGLFDVVILDEATQCDIASCLPLLQRGKRVVVVGDPKQLRHISFLPHSRQEAIADECQLTIEQQNQFSFRTRSILDAVSDSMRDPHSVVLLNEHFRSLPSIVQFSNETFYAGALSIMRQRPSNHGLRSVTLRPVAGKRLDKGHNPIEGEALLEELARRIAAQDGPQTSRTHAAGPPWLAAGQVEPPSIGILAPLREQADYLTEGLDRYFSWEQLQRHDLLVGTAHTFQGEERDLMLLSLTADDDSHAATFRFLSDPHVLNVSVTRARHEQLIFLSFDPQRLGPQSLLQRYLASVERPWRPTRPAQRPVDTFRSQLIAALAGKPLRFWKDYAVAGVSLDLIIEAQERMLGVDLVGYPGTLSQSLLLERYRILRRAGLEVFPLSYRLWKRCPTTCVERIGQFFEMEI